jgi:hypothetical protein
VDTLLTGLVSERDQKVALIKNYAEAARVDKRDLTDVEQETMTKAKTRMAELDVQIGLLADDLEMADETKEKLRQVSIHVPRETHYRSGGEVMYDLLHQSDEFSRQRLQNAMKRAAEHMGTEKTATTPVAGDLGGLVVSATKGPIIDTYPRATFASALGLTESPDAMHFMRPRIVDAAFATSTGPQTLEKGELPSKAFEVTADPVSLTTIGQYLNISQQLISLQSGSLDLITSHMIRRVAWAVDLALLNEMDNSTGAVPLAAAATAAEVLQAVYDASAMVFQATGELAEWIVMGPLGYARIGGLTDLAGRPLFPTLGANNAPGTANAASFVGQVAGLRVIVTPAIVDEVMWVGNSGVIEGYVYRFPVLEAIEPSVLGRQVAVAVALAGYRPVPNGAVKVG